MASFLTFCVWKYPDYSFLIVVAFGCVPDDTERPGDPEAVSKAAAQGERQVAAVLARRVPQPRRQQESRRQPVRFWRRRRLGRRGEQQEVSQQQPQKLDEQQLQVSALAMSDLFLHCSRLQKT